MSHVIRRLKKWRSYLDLFRRRPPDHADHDYRNVFLKSRERIAPLLPVPLNEASVLIIGCGYACPDVILYEGCAVRVCGLDVQPVFYRDGFMRLYRECRCGRRAVLGPLRAAYEKRKGLRGYYRRLHRLAGRRADHRALDLRVYDGRAIPFADETFDAVLSNAVLEHVMDLEAFFREVRRVTRPGGISYHLYHNYYSFSGGHVPEEDRLSDPWGHLRGIHSTDPGHLNQVAVGSVRRLFCCWFELIQCVGVGANHARQGMDPGFEYERPDLLTPELRAELSQYDAEQLLTRSYLVIGRRPQDGPAAQSGEVRHA